MLDSNYLKILAILVVILFFYWLYILNTPNNSTMEHLQGCKGESSCKKENNCIGMLKNVKNDENTFDYKVWDEIYPETGKITSKSYLIIDGWAQINTITHCPISGKTKRNPWMWTGPRQCPYPWKTPYDLCYEWRKITKRSCIWSNLPRDLVDLISKYCRHPKWQRPIKI